MYFKLVYPRLCETPVIWVCRTIAAMVVAVADLTQRDHQPTGKAQHSSPLFPEVQPGEQTQRKMSALLI